MESTIFYIEKEIGKNIDILKKIIHTKYKSKIFSEIFVEFFTIKTIFKYFYIFLYIFLSGMYSFPKYSGKSNGF